MGLPPNPNIALHCASPCSTLTPGENGQAGPPHAHTASGGQPPADTYPGVASGGQGEGPGPATALSQHGSGEHEGAAHGMLGLTPEMVNQYPPPRLPRSAWSLPVERPSANGSGTATARRLRQQQRAEAAAVAAAAPTAGESGPQGSSAPLASSTAEASLLPSPQQPAAAETDASMVSPFSNLPRQEGKEPHQPLKQQQEGGEENGVKVSTEAEPSFRFSVLPPGEPALPAPAAARSGSSGQPARFRAAAAAVGAAAAAVAAVAGAAGRRGKSSRGSKQAEPEPESAAGQTELKGARGSSASPPRVFAHGLAEGGSGAASGSSSIKRRGSGPPLGLPAVNTGASPKPAYTRQSTGGTAGSAGTQSPRASVSFAPGSEPPAKAGRPNLGRPSSGAPALALHHPFDEEAAQVGRRLGWQGCEQQLLLAAAAAVAGSGFMCPAVGRCMHCP